MDEWIRLPADGEKCPHTGLSRSSLNEILNETDPETGEKLVLSSVKIKEGAKRGIKLINRQSLLDYLMKQAESQNGLRFAPHIANPEHLSIDELLESMEDFNNFLDPDISITEEAWERGAFSTRRLRLLALMEVGAVIRVTAEEGETGE
ncbi:MAG: hypothetical protein WCH43_06065 [Verrucomicrobiota bacterium]